MLNKESKTGTIKKINIRDLAVIGATVGVLAVSITSLSKSIERNSAISSYNSDKYSSYSKQIESVYDVDIADDTERIINNLGDKQTLVEEYKEATTAIDKSNIFQEMYADDLEKQALAVVKQKVADEHGDAWEDYTISNTEPSYEPANWIIRKNGEKAIELDSKSSALVQKVANLQSAYDTKDMDNYVDSYNQVIKATVKYVGKTSDKAK